jgi:hypothetical protein
MEKERNPVKSMLPAHLTKEAISLFFLICLFTCAYIVWAISSLYPLLLPHTPLASRQNLFCPYL